MTKRDRNSSGPVETGLPAKDEAGRTRDPLAYDSHGDGGEQGHDDPEGEGRDRPPSGSERDPKDPWLGGG